MCEPPRHHYKNKCFRSIIKTANKIIIRENMYQILMLSTFFYILFRSLYSKRDMFWLLGEYNNDL